MTLIRRVPWSMTSHRSSSQLHFSPEFQRAPRMKFSQFPMSHSCRAAVQLEPVECERVLANYRVRQRASQHLPRRTAENTF